MLKIYLLFCLIMSITAIILYLSDKLKARHGAWRIKEKLLLGVGLFGGSVGALLAMKIFRHKTRHWYFWAVNFIGLALQTAILVILQLK